MANRVEMPKFKTFKDMVNSFNIRASEDQSVEVRAAARLVRMAKELMGEETPAKREASAGPYTMLAQLAKDFKSGDLDLEMWGHAMGYSKGADYIVGAGEDIVTVLIHFDKGRSDEKKVMAVIKKNIREALEDNEIFKGLRAEQSQKVWMSYMDEQRKRM
jgi:hypothetical protein